MGFCFLTRELSQQNSPEMKSILYLSPHASIRVHPKHKLLSTQPPEHSVFAYLRLWTSPLLFSAIFQTSTRLSGHLPVFFLPCCNHVFPFVSANTHTQVPTYIFCIFDRSRELRRGVCAKHLATFYFYFLFWVLLVLFWDRNLTK